MDEKAKAALDMADAIYNIAKEFIAKYGDPDISQFPEDVQAKIIEKLSALDSLIQ